MNIEHTPEDAAILRRTDPHWHTWRGDLLDLCAITAHMKARAKADFDAVSLKYCLAADGHHGKEWLDLMSEMRGAA